MRILNAAALALLLLSAVARAADAPPRALAVWLAAGPKCNTCELFLEVAERRAYLDAVKQGERRIPLRRVGKGDLSDGVLAQLPASIGPASPHWDLQLIVMVMGESERVLYAGNIADSADLRDLRYDERVMFPPAQPAEDHPARRHAPPYAAFFKANWNLEYFLEVAEQRRAPREESALVDLQAETPLPRAPRIILWGSAATPLANASFIGNRLTQAQAVFEALSPAAERVTLHGHGPRGRGPDESVIVDGELRFRRAELDRDLAATASDLNAVFTAVARAPQARTLLFQAGHAGPTGAPLWGHGLPLRPEHLAPLSEQGELVMVSGACHGGQFARAASCGFFAAHPEVTATGCQLSASAIEGSDDYLRWLLQFLQDAAASDRPTSLHAAHWYASARLEHHQVPYSTSDALIDEAFADGDKSSAWPSHVSVDALRAGAHVLSDAEGAALAHLLNGLEEDQQISLKDYIARNVAADTVLRDARELTSAQRNAQLDLPYPLALALLARRVIYRQRHPDDQALEAVLACEQQPLRRLLAPSPGSAAR